MVDKNDWRLNGQEEYLFGETLYFRKWDMSNINSHEHCIFCWEKISSILNTPMKDMSQALIAIGSVLNVLMISKTVFSGIYKFSKIFFFKPEVARGE